MGVERLTTKAQIERHANPTARLYLYADWRGPILGVHPSREDALTPLEVTDVR